MRNLIILNPSSFKGKALEVRSDVESAFKNHGLDYEIHVSKSSEDIISTVKPTWIFFQTSFRLAETVLCIIWQMHWQALKKILGAFPWVQEMT